MVFSSTPGGRTTGGKIRRAHSCVQGVAKFGSLHVVRQSQGFNLTGGVVSNIASVIGRFKEVVILRSSLLASPCFLGFVGRTLSLCRSRRQIVDIRKCVCPVGGDLPSAFFVGKTSYLK